MVKLQQTGRPPDHQGLEPAITLARILEFPQEDQTVTVYLVSDRTPQLAESVRVEDELHRVKNYTNTE